jgi:hypothetical protein
MAKNYSIGIFGVMALQLLGKIARSLVRITISYTNNEVIRDRLFSLYKQLAPDAVQRRLYDLQKHRGAYIVPGPNYLVN